MWDSWASRSDVLNYETENVILHYKFGKELGTGFSGIVKMCEDLLTGELLACKSIDKGKLQWDDYDDVRMEISILKKLSHHPNVVGLRSVHEDDGAVHLVMELCRGGDLFEEVVKRGPLTEVSAIRVIAQISEALVCCHSSGIMHRDLKPENILLTKEWNRKRKEEAHEDEEIDVKLADFGLAVGLGKFQEAAGFAGSPYYIAPEIITQTWYGKEADIWSLGVVLYVLLSGEFPFSGDTDKILFKKIQTAKFEMTNPPWPSISDACKLLIRQMLTKDASKRPTAQDILYNPWVIQMCNRQKSDCEIDSDSDYSLLDFVSNRKNLSDASTRDSSLSPIESPTNSMAEFSAHVLKIPANGSSPHSSLNGREINTPPSPNSHFDIESIASSYPSTPSSMSSSDVMDVSDSFKDENSNSETTLYQFSTNLFSFLFPCFPKKNKNVDTVSNIVIGVPVIPNEVSQNQNQSQS